MFMFSTLQIITWLAVLFTGTLVAQRMLNSRKFDLTVRVTRLSKKIDVTLKGQVHHQPAIKKTKSQKALNGDVCATFLTIDC